jgi:3-phenylpropionate/trans-cinnamate dioxygenase ferredoxin reductase subunit
MNTYTYIIIGGGIAGGNAAGSIREIDPEGTIALVTEEVHPPYQRPPLSKAYLQGKAKLNKVYLHKANHYTERDIKLITESRIIKISPDKHTVVLENGQELMYGKLLLATGGHTWRLPIAGHDLPGVFTLRSIEDADAIREIATPGKHALVLGGSFIGAEVAASLSIMGLKVTMVFPESRLLVRAVPEELSVFLHNMYKKRGVRILNGTTPQKLEGDVCIKRAHLSNDEILDVDMVVMGVGIKLNTQLAKEAGLALTDAGAIIVDETLRTSAPDIYAAGDIAAWPDPTFNTRLRVEHWDVAREQGAQAGRNMAGTPEAYTALPYFFSDLFDFSFEAWGNLTAWDHTVLQGSLDANNFTFYYFTDEQIVGILAVNPSDELRDQIPQLIKKRLTYPAMRDLLGQE